jgi:hypothetical protein
MRGIPEEIKHQNEPKKRVGQFGEGREQRQSPVDRAQDQVQCREQYDHSHPVQKGADQIEANGLFVRNEAADNCGDIRRNASPPEDDCQCPES